MRRAKLSNVSLREMRVVASFVVFVLLAAMMLTPFGGIIASVAAASIERSVIVTLKDEPAAVWKAKQQKAGRQVSDADLQAYRDSITAKQDSFLSGLAARGITAAVDGVDVLDFDGSNAGRVDFRFNLVLNAVTLKVPNSQLSALAAMPQVKSVKPNKQMRLLLNKSVPYINAPPVYGQFAELTQFDNFREGFEGQGVNVAVLDTGIDWKHEMFGGDPTPPRLGVSPNVAAVQTNQKVIYYLPLTAGAAIDGYGHGTAASSDIAGYAAMAPGHDKIPGTADDIKVHGVAPQARLMGYKVCVDVGSCLNASTIMGIEDAVSPVTKTLQPKPVAHVINMSLGGAGTPDDDTAIAADNAALLGTIVVASAGNSGPGSSTIGSPSTGRHVISVAASSDPGSASEVWSADLLQADTIPAAAVGAVNPADGLAAQDGFDRLRLYKMADAPNPAARAIAQRYVMVDLFPANTYSEEVAGRIALIKDSGLASATFMDICNSAAANGAIAALYISTTLNPGAIHGLIPCAVVDPDTGNILIDAMKSDDDNVTDPANGTVSDLPIRINPYKDNIFYGDTTSFSSRGPVAGLGQVKPDVTAPGLAVLSATVRVGSPDRNTGMMFDPTGYTHATGTSFSAPHVAGSVALIKQAHLDWSPDMVRTALINTATNLRTESGSPKADGEGADAVNEQGGGLVNVAAAIRTKAIMGVTADGITLPAILGSHSFGEKAVLNNRVNNSFSVPVVIRDVSGEGGTYTLSTVNNRSTSQNGVSTGTSTTTVNVPAGGSATFNATISINGDIIRSTDTQEMQWYVVATSSSGKKLRMPFYLQATGSVPGDAVSLSETTQYTGTVPVGDAGGQRDQELYLGQDVNYVDIPVQVGASTVKLDGLLKFTVAQDVPGVTGVPDLDFLLFDPNGDKIGESAGSTDSEHIAVNTTIPGEYIWRVYGFIAAATEFTLDSTQMKGGGAPVVQPFASNFTLGGTRHDFDGDLNLTWNPQGAVDAFEIEHSTDGTNWETLGQVPGSATSQTIAGVGDGVHSYRIRSIVPGKIGKFVTQPSNTESITVSRRVETDATDKVNQLNRSIAFNPGSTEIVAALKNISTTTLYPNMRLEITGVASTGNTVRVSNADNGGNGVTNVAAFDYSQLVGADFAAAEESGNKTLRFSNPNNQLFTITVRVIANVATGTGGGGGSGGSTSGSTSGGTSGGGSTGGGTASGTLKVFRFTVNPLTKTISLLK